MRQRLLPLCVLACALVLSDRADAHGSNWPPPPPPPTWKPPTPLGNPQPAGRRAPAQPKAPSAPLSPGAGSGISAAPASPKLDSFDASSWSVWWAYNRDAYLGLKVATWSGQEETTSDGFFLGRGDARRSLWRLRPSDEEIRGKVVPTLLGVLEKEDGRALVTSVLIALGQIGEVLEDDGPDAVANIIRAYLPDANQTISETAVVSLSLLRNPNVLPDVAGILNDSERGAALLERSSVPSRTRAFAALGLGLIGERSENEDVRRFVVGELARALRNDDTASDELGVACATALGMVRVADGSREDGRPPSASRSAQVRFLAGELLDEDGRTIVRAHLARSLGRVVGEQAGPELLAPAAEALLETLQSRKASRELQVGCVLALGLVADADEDELDREMRDALRKIVRGRDATLRNFALVALAQAGGRSGEGQGAARGAVRADPLAARPEVMRELLRSLEHGDTGTRPWAALALGLIGDATHDSEPDPASRAAREALGILLGETEAPSETAAYAIALGLSRALESQALLLGRLDEVRDSQTRGEICLALGLMGSLEALPQLRATVRASKYDPVALRQAAIGLALLGDKDLVPELLAVMAESTSSAVKGVVASTMGQVGDARAVGPLIAMIENEDLVERSRALAVVALGHLADRDEIPWTSAVATNVNYQAYSEILNSSEATGLLNMR